MSLTGATNYENEFLFHVVLLGSLRSTPNLAYICEYPSLCGGQMNFDALRTIRSGLYACWHC
jgi:hypothetical protein